LRQKRDPWHDHPCEVCRGDVARRDRQSRRRCDGMIQGSSRGSIRVWR
jgi:hypothetical protein